MASIFSSPLLHTAYYFREVFSPAPSRETEALKALVFREHGFGDRIRYKDFALSSDSFLYTHTSLGSNFLLPREFTPAFCYPLFRGKVYNLFF